MPDGLGVTERVAEEVILSDLDGLTEGVDPAIITELVGDRESVGLGDRDSVGLGVRELVGDRESVGLGDRDPVGLTVIDPVGLTDRDPDADIEDDSGTRPYEIENTGLPPAPAIGTPVGKTIVRVEFC